MNTQIKTAYISYYTGYRNERYDGYGCTWGILSALGASPTADCCADADDSTDDEFDSKWNDERIGHTDDFRTSVLQNLDLSKSDIVGIMELEEDEEYEHQEFWGNSEINITFKNVNGEIICNYDGEAEYKCEF